MGLTGIVICALCAVVFWALLKQSSREYSLLFSLAVCAVLLAAVLKNAGPLVSRIRELAGTDASLGGVLPPVLKAVGIALAGEMACRVCKDAGESALSWAVELAVKAAVLGVSLPLVTRLLEYLKEILTL